MSDVLIVYDRHNWCLHFAAMGIKRYWDSQRSVEIACQNDPDIDEKVKSAKRIVAMCRGTYQRIRSVSRRTFVAVGSHKVLPNAQNKELLRDVAGVLCANHFLLNEWAPHHHNACYGPIGFDPALFMPCACPPLDGRVVLGWVGDPSRPEKRFNEVVLKACKRLAKRAELRVATPNAFIPHDELRDHFYSRLHAFIVASTSEGGPQPAIEAMACSVPVIATRVGMLVDVMSDGCFFDGTVSGLVSAFERMFEDHDQYRTMRESVASSVAHLSWRVAVRWWEDAIK